MEKILRVFFGSNATLHFPNPNYSPKIPSFSLSPSSSSTLLLPLHQFASLYFNFFSVLVAAALRFSAILQVFDLIWFDSRSLFGSILLWVCSFTGDFE